MLNIGCIFGDADRVTPHFGRLNVRPLPAAVYMMQVDVINHYRYALDHYFRLTLREPYLQNSSHGTPFQKWAFFMNRDFDTLSFAIHNLMRYTSRLVYESEYNVLRDARHFSGAKGRASAYIGHLVELRDGKKSIGIRINEDNSLYISSLRTDPIAENIISRSSAGGTGETVVVTTDAQGKTFERPIDRDEYLRLTGEIRSEKVAIGDRSILSLLQGRGHAEVAGLATLNRDFAEATNEFYKSKNVAEPFENYIGGWCI